MTSRTAQQTMDLSFTNGRMELKWNPIDFNFRWTIDGWYEFDRRAAHRAALAARNVEARRLRAAGRVVKTWTVSGNLITKGGIGSGFPHIEEVVSIYGLTVH